MGKIVDGVFYNSEGIPTHAGIVKVEGKLYYAGKGGSIVKDQKKIIHHGMANGLVKHGLYYFDKNGVIRLSSYRKPTKKKKTVSKTVITKRVGIAVALLIALALAWALLKDHLPKSSQEAAQESAIAASVEASSAYDISLPQFDDQVYLCTETMKQYYQGQLTLEQAAKAGTAVYNPFQFQYSMRNAVSATLLLSEQEDYSDYTEYPLDVSGYELVIDNLKTATTYYYLILAKDTEGRTHANGGDFTTADTNRFISLPGVYNSRDIGGYKTADGSRVKQGMLIRGTELDGLVENFYYLSDPQAAAPLGFVYEFDLRNSDIISTPYISRLGSNVGHKFYNAPAYGAIFRDWQKESLREIFADLADERHYPMYLHCTYGTDRTGTIVFLLQGILGVSEEDMIKEYSLTGLLNKAFLSHEQLQIIYDGLQGVSGETINEKIENFLVDTVGVSLADIKQIRSILLEKA